MGVQQTAPLIMLSHCLPNHILPAFFVLHIGYPTIDTFIGKMMEFTLTPLKYPEDKCLSNPDPMPPLIPPAFNLHNPFKN
jgi:hypothetical protein